jgi:snail-like protein
MPYQLNHHHHHNLLPVDQSSLSPTSSHASYNSFASSSNASMRSVSPPLEDSPANYSISVLMEKSTSNSNIQKLSKSEKSEKSSAPPRYQCPDCGKSYSTYSGLSKHQQFHCAANESNQVQKTVTCNECGKVYASTGALKMHIRTHTLPCKCHLCGKAFSRPWLLQGHIRTHTGEKPFSCNHCHRAFADRSNLRAHLQTHSDVKKYSCTTCSKTFSRMSLLTKHNDSGCPGIQIQSPDNFASQIVPGKNIQVY